MAGPDGRAAHSAPGNPAPSFGATPGAPSRHARHPASGRVPSKRGGTPGHGDPAGRLYVGCWIGVGCQAIFWLRLQQITCSRPVSLWAADIHAPACWPPRAGARCQATRRGHLGLQELVECAGPGADASVGRMVPALLSKAATGSVAGRGAFLATEANAALAAVVACCSDCRVTTVLLDALTRSRSADARGSAATHLGACLARCAGPRRQQSCSLLEWSAVLSFARACNTITVICTA